ncbi:MAG: hypothetical protein QM497_09960, partial [Sulfurimonas sp.]
MKRNKVIPEGFAVGSRPRTGKISDRALSNIVGIPVQTLQDWKKKDDNWRKVLYKLLKNMSEDEIRERLKK